MDNHKILEKAFFALMGKSPEEAAAELQRLGLSYRIVYTSALKKSGDQQKRVVRITEKDGELEVLISFFQPPLFSKG